MAPLPDPPSFKSYLASLLRRNSSPSTAHSSSLGTKLTRLALAARSPLLRRDGVADARKGVTPPDNMPNKTVFILLGLIGAGFVVTGIWFFFWAKNGGFYYKEDDWDEYKSTVLRRKGPNGTTLSGATESTVLGGGSIVHGQDDEDDEKRSRWGRRKKGMKRYKDFDEETGSQVTSSLGGSTLGSEISERQRQRKKDEPEKKKKKSRKSRKSAAASEAGTEDEMDAGVRDAVRAYRHEKPARVGGINRQPDGSSWDGSTATSELLSHRETTPTSTPAKKSRRARQDTYTYSRGAGIRKVAPSTSDRTSVSFFSRSSNPADDDGAAEKSARIKAEARKLQEKGRAAQRRDFSFSVGDDVATASSVVSASTAAAHERQARREEREQRRRQSKSRSPTKKLPGSYVVDDEERAEFLGPSPDAGPEVGTKVYHHPIPGLASSTAGSSEVSSSYVEERRRKRNGGGGGGGGYRRGRRDSLSE